MGTQRGVGRVIVAVVMLGAASAGAESPSKPAEPPAARALPEYMEHWEFGLEAGDDIPLRYFADLIVPLARSPDDIQTFFLEPRVRHTQGETLLNLGVGYRQLVQDRAWLLGANLFYDHDTHLAHTRLGAGLEALSAYAEARVNGYFGLTNAREERSGLSANILERAVDGFDLEIGGPIPYYSRVKLFGGYEWYDFKQFEDREGWSVRLEYTPVPYLVLDLLLADNTKRETGWAVNTAVRLPFGGNAPARAVPLGRLDHAMFPDSDVSGRTMALVERHHEIVVERFSQNVGGMNVEIRRGT